MDPELFGETVIYHPQGNRSVSRSINATVMRKPAAILPESRGGGGHGGGITAEDILVLVKNDATTGISTAELDWGRDTLELPIVEGGPIKTMRFVRKPDSDEGKMLLLRVR